MRSLLPRGSERLRLAGEGLWVATGQGLQMVGVLLGIRVLTELVSREVFGQVALLVGLSALVSTAFVTPFVQATVRFYPDADREGRLGALRDLSSGYLLRFSLLSAALVLIPGAAWSIWRPGGPGFAAYLGLGVGVLVEARRNFETGLLNAARRQASSALWLAVDAWLRPALAVALVLAAGEDAVWVLAGYALGSAASNAMFRTRRVIPAPTGPAIDEAWQRAQKGAYRSFVAPLIPLALLGWAFSLGDRYILAWSAGADATGLYAAAYPIASRPFLSLSGVLVTTFRPVLYEAVSRGDRHRERRLVSAWIALVVLVGTVGVVLLDRFGDSIVRWTLGSDFRAGAKSLLPWIGAAYACQALQNVFETRMFARRRTGAFAALHVASAAVAVALYLVLIPRMGAMGAALGTFGGMVASCAVSAFLSNLPMRTPAVGTTS